MPMRYLSGRSWRALPAALASLLLLTAPAQAALTIGATRVVFEGNQRNTTVMVRNPSSQVYAAQVWVNTEADDTTTPVPLMPSPGLFRLDPGKEQLVRINGLPHNLPNERESLFFFNVQEIPQAKADADMTNVLTIALRTRIKVFYRPEAIRGDPHKRLKDLSWQWDASTRQLIVHNPSPYYITFKRVAIGDGAQHRLRSAMVAPFSAQRFSVPADQGQPSQVSFSAINDYGGISKTQSATVLPQP